ncbi:hypothetical protein SS05631_c29650 [Sinorhizobium sp. CCBAU 05631]|nr:hypothetical protein SS05631_c29650 [Sinorhizobium sp. CCBAU 05631]
MAPAHTVPVSCYDEGQIAVIRKLRGRRLNREIWTEQRQ